MPSVLHCAITAAALATALFCRPAAAAPLQEAPCAMNAADKGWLDSALQKWPAVKRRFLASRAPRRSTIIVYDSACTYFIPAPGNAVAQSVKNVSVGQVTTPHGTGLMAPGPNAMNTTTPEGERWVIMALPSLFAPVAPKSNVPLEWMLESILFHELTHAYQALVSPATDYVTLQRRGFPADVLSSHIIQDRFSENAAYSAAIGKERETLFAAALAADTKSARRLTCEVVATAGERRRRFLGEPLSAGFDVSLAAFDDIAVSLEGLASWTAYKWLTEGRGVDRASALAALKGPYWAYETGLPTLLIIERLVPRWRRLLLTEPPVLGASLLERACKAG